MTEIPSIRLGDIAAKMPPDELRVLTACLNSDQLARHSLARRPYMVPTDIVRVLREFDAKIDMARNEIAVRKSIGAQAFDDVAVDEQCVAAVESAVAGAK